MPCILKYMACVFCDKPCVFSHIPKRLHSDTDFCAFRACVFPNIGEGLENSPEHFFCPAFAVCPIECVCSHIFRHGKHVCLPQKSSGRAVSRNQTDSGRKPCARYQFILSVYRFALKTPPASFQKSHGRDRS